MTFLSFRFYLFVAALGVVYYLVPRPRRWIVLLAGSLAFYYQVTERGFFLFLATIAASWLLGLALAGAREKKFGRVLLFFAVALAAAPLLLIKEGNFLLSDLLGRDPVGFIVPLGVSFYTMQIIAYLVDVYKKEVEPERNPARYALFVSYFPQIVQGPIPRFDQLSAELRAERRFDERIFTKGLQLVLWGFFLKLMIADKAGVVVDTVFASPDVYRGSYVLLAGFLYSIQLYTDFQACVCIAQGVSSLFGIELVDNFKRPYFSRSTKEFWGRWHISLSLWLRDYIYIPLGGNRRGKARKRLNLVAVFLVSGIWHGAGYKYLFWGLLHAFYMIAGELTKALRVRLYGAVRLERESVTGRILQTLVTFFLVMLAWIVFRAGSLRTALGMIASIFTVYNPWALSGGGLFALGLDGKDCVVLLLSMLVLALVSFWQERHEKPLRDWVLEQHLLLRWGLYVGAVVVIVLFGTYGFGFNAQDFIYGGF